MKELGVVWNDQSLIFNSEKTLFLEKHKILVISDVHFGKSRYFQIRGIPANEQTEIEDFQRIEKLLHWYRPKLLLILGDFYHHPSTINLELLKKLGEKCHLHFITGNHEGYGKKLDIPFDQSTYLIKENLCFAHDNTTKISDKEASMKMRIGGHIHPVIKIRNHLDSFRAPCFALGARQLIVPSFGTFTGGFEIDIKKFDTILIVVNEDLIKI